MLNLLYIIAAFVVFYLSYVINKIQKIKESQRKLREAQNSFLRAQKIDNAIKNFQSVDMSDNIRRMRNKKL